MPDLLDFPRFKINGQDLRFPRLFLLGIDILDTIQPSGNLAIRRNDDGVSIAHALSVVSATLCRSYDPALRLDGPAPQQYLPVKFPCWYSERRRVEQDLGA